MKEAANKPLKRTEHIILLSRDHHAGLLFCWKIKEGLKLGVEMERINQYADYFWNQHLKYHFKEEETLLFQALDCPETAKGHADHQLLSSWFSQIIGGQFESAEDYRFFAGLLINHIRFEERELFPFLERMLPLETLVFIGNALLKNHRQPFVDNYPDEFWIK